jgi:hypothetical protein
MTPEPRRAADRPTGMISLPRHPGPSLVLLPLLVGVLVLSACAATDGSAGTPAVPSSTPPAGSPPAPTPTVPAGGKLMTLTGEVSAGVEAGCTILTAGDRVYELQGGAVRELSGTVTVTGHVLHNVMTICQQGTPFRVVDVKTS